MNYIKRLYHTTKTSIANDPTFPACMLMLLIFAVCIYSSLEIHDRRIDTLESQGVLSALNATPIRVTTIILML